VAGHFAHKLTILGVVQKLSVWAAVRGVGYRNFWPQLLFSWHGYLKMLSLLIKENNSQNSAEQKKGHFIGKICKHKQNTRNCIGQTVIA
jgi:hypothetical protein